MKNVILSTVIVAAIFQPVLAQDDEPETDPAAGNEAPATFADAVNAAHAAYIESLEASLELALAEDKLDDAIHLRRMIAMEQLRADLTDTRWTWNRPNDPDSIHFHENRVVTTGKGGEGVWDVIEERVVVVKFGSTAQDLWLYQFNEDRTSYSLRTYKFNPRTNYTGGRRVGGE